MSLVVLLLLGQSVVAAEGPPPQAGATRAPAVVVERVVEAGSVTQRLTLFSNRVAVVSVRSGAQQVMLRRLTLEDNEYAAYVVAVARNLDQVPHGQGVTGPPGGGRGVITASVGSSGARRVEYSSLAVPELALGRLIGVLDDLAERVLASEPGEEELRGWTPTVGDVVELVTGERARVVEVREGGLILLDVERAPLQELVPPEQRPRRIRRVVEAPR